MSKKCGLLLLFIFCIAGLTPAQQEMLEVGELFSLVKKNHPVAAQAYLQREMAKANLLRAKGVFDPIVVSGFDQKEFKGSDYFRLFDAQLIVPTKLGLDIKAGYESNRGAFLNPENNTPFSGLAFAGVSLPLGRGLLTDDRRALVNTALIQQDIAGVQEELIMNDLLYDAGVLYWDWFRAYHNREIFREALDNAIERFEAVKLNVLAGDSPGIDTVEAKIQIQNVNIGLNQAQNEFNQMSALFSGLFWDDQFLPAGERFQKIPTDIPQSMIPEGDPSLFLQDDDFVRGHPILEEIRLMLKQMEIEQKLRRDRLKPELNLTFYPLAEVTGSDVLTNFSPNDYKVGIDFRAPLFFRRERGDAKLIELEILNRNLDLKNSSVELLNTYKAQLSEWVATREQMEILSENVELFETMYNAERRLFQIGESSLFLVNAREQAWINAKVQLLRMIAKNKAAYYAIFYFAGKMNSIAG
jgi:outer membrane protein TolC